MNTYEIFSDSSCDITLELLNKHNINLIPFYVTFNQENYFKENIDISNSEFYERLVTDKIFPKTSLPSVSDYINSFKTALLEGKDVLCICLTHKFSGSYQSAMNAKLILEETFPNASINIIDSILATSAQGLLVLQAAYMKENNYSLTDNINRLEEIKHTSRIMFTVNSLEYLSKGGRIGKVASLAGTMLNLKPMIQFKQGELIPYSNVRGRKKSLSKMLDMVIEYFTEQKLDYNDFDFCITNSITDENSTELVEITNSLETLIGKKLSYPMFNIGITIGTNTGPGAIGICFIQNFK